MIHHLHILSPQTPLTPPPPIPPPHRRRLINHETPPLPRRTRSSYKWQFSALERSESKFEVDPDKARQALDELDQQLDSLSTKQVNPPKIKVVGVGSPTSEELERGYQHMSLVGYSTYCHLVLGWNLTWAYVQSSSSPRTASSLNILNGDVKFENSEISGSFLTFTAIGLFLFSIFYNIIFLTVIKPSIDIPENIESTNVTASEITAEFLQNQ